MAEDKFEEFRRATGATMRAISRQPELTVEFSSDETGLKGNEAVLPLPSRDLAAANGVENESFPDLRRWSMFSSALERVRRSVARVQSLLGPESVTAPEWQGGRTPAEQYRLIRLIDEL